ncbi:MAG: NAD(+)/NADH kinase [Candidatus Cloacimonetes bacterium]|jgi:NAD+ kinase|nr:NAD(+)/NADH kinase [Candidatus Cloacimonadota bacterium]HOD59308.1 NAD(+)/NADH kinase [Candidatus Syntrophosphaera sp.]HQM79197.1 NAD(+)/NADH kinase [Candidatus Syntrophosphaera sp.]HQP84429.1 NAD(+)/NADH kinase [Candidatus Syntrophosphaera thermopropionivorans]
MKNFVIYINQAYKDKTAIYELLEELKSEDHLNFYGIPEQQDILPPDIHILQNDKTPQIDCVLAFGGDGTILRAKKIALKTRAPILGINIGYLGFLSETTLGELKSSLRDLLNKKYRLQERMLIQCQLRRNGTIIYKDLALNDAVACKAEMPKLIGVRIFNNRRFVFDTRCDGVIVSTPTGSTAYSLAAGGPILSPEMKAMVLSPLNPHLLTVRSMVFPSTDHLLLRVHNLEAPATLQIDGVNCSPIEENDEVVITAAKQTVQFVKLSNRTFYQILRRKLHLGK